ncbi:MAG: hypothetical protein AAFY56_24170, partial [Pseudomonadota bacterium]
MDPAYRSGISRLLVLLVAMWTSSACAETSVEDENLVFLEEVTGSDLCSSGGVLDGIDSLRLASVSSVSGDDRSFSTHIDHELYRRMVVERFDTEEYRCLSLDSKSLPSSFRGFWSADLIRNSGHVSVHGLRVPIIVSRAQDFEYQSVADRRTIYVRVPGGPGQTDIISPSDELIDYFEDTLVIDFFYTGNGFNTIHPQPAFDIASSQLAFFLKEVRARNPDANIVLIGISLGAVISTSAMNIAEPSDIALDSLVLLSPPFASLEEVGPRLEALPGADDMTKRSVSYRLRDVNSNYNVEGKEVELDWTEVFERFYSAEQGEVRLVDRLRQIGGHQRTLIIYGYADERIAPELAAQFLVDPI